MYDKYVSFLENFAPCISGFLSGIMFHGFCSIINNCLCRVRYLKDYFKLHIKAYIYNITILYKVVFAFKPHLPCLLGSGMVAAGH